MPRSVQRGFYGPDSASNSRNAFLLYGGTGSNQEVLTDAWEFDFQFQFWSAVKTAPGGPAADSGIAGGIDSRSSTPQAINNTFYVLKSGNDMGLWRFNVSGTLASNIPDGVLASWDRKSVSNLPSFANSAGTVVGSKVVSVGGCTNPANNSCAFVVDDNGSLTNIPSCASPRSGARVIPNFSTASTGFSSQVFLLLGTLESGWQDDNGLNQGEVAVLDINTGTWSRLIPSGDPSVTPSVPSPREGAAISVLPGGGGSGSSSDVIVFGGRDASGSYLDDMWILRAYNGVITPSSPRWSGFGDGNLQGGYGANGAGVTVKYLEQCASRAVSPTSTSGSPNPTTTTTPGNDDGGSSSSNQSGSSFDTSVSHKVLSPISIALLFLALLLHRGSAYMSHGSSHAKRQTTLTYASAFVLTAAYASGLAGIITSFTSITNTSMLAKRSASSSLVLKTTHGRVGLAFFVAVYGLVAVLFLSKLSKLSKLTPSPPRSSISRPRMSPRPSEDKSHIGSTSHTSSPPSGSPRPRTQSLTLIGHSSIARTSHDRLDDDAASMSSSGPQRTFEVLNRPKRRRPSGGVMAVEPRAASRSLSEMDWLQRRRSLNAVGELDYAISQAIRAEELPPTPGTTDVLMAISPRKSLFPSLPPPLEIIVRITLHIALCGLCVVALNALWTRASSKVYFALLLVWVLLSYVLFIVLAWHGRPPTSILSHVIARLRGKSPLPPPPTTTPEQYRSVTNTPTPHTPSPGYPFPMSVSGPYTHHFPPHRIAGPEEFSYASPRSVETDYDDDPDEDEDSRQQRIESEMGRREVSIVTVPKRKLWIANPS
ncbi:hypothetical protein V5O48_002470 [Marasmius crinis-equi]|uniref:Uncharacterized protein n=1 Tax=Marasmius crinis-equi TaxID=585013 RepID=A0ABR3FWL9_9AGAR